MKPVLFSSGPVSKDKAVNTFQMKDMNKHSVQQGAF